MQKKRVLGPFTLAMMTVAAIVSLRNLPLSAEFGLTSIFYFVVSALIFFIPIALVTAELASSWPQAGGAYLWVGEAFGKRWGFYVLWTAWMAIIAWYPAILAFTAAMLAHLVAPLFPGLEESKAFYFAVMLSVFWGMTFLNFLGVQTSGWVSALGVLSGTVIPGIFIIGLGLWWLASGHPSHIAFTWDAVLPEFQLNSMVFFAGILLSLMGVEVAAYHIRDAKRPERDYPRAIGVAVLLILAVSILGTLAIAMVVPQKEISLLSGLIQAFTVFFKAFDMAWAVPLLAFLALMGSLATVNTWIVGPAKGLLETAQEGFLPPWLGRVNRKGVPVGMLIFQAIIGSGLSLIFLGMDSHSAAYWVLTALSAQFALVQYGFVFASAVRLRITKPNIERAYRVPGDKWGIWTAALIGICACLFGFLIVLVPPHQLAIGDKRIYQGWLVMSFIALSIIPVGFSVRRSQSRV